MFTYETNLFRNGRRVFRKEITLTQDDLLFHVGKSGREAFINLINTWNRQGMINVENHGNVYVYVAL